MVTTLIIEIGRCIKYSYKTNRFMSETGEDIVIKQFLDKTPGRFVDVGAHHPIIGSNTWALYKDGWSGIAIEPQNTFNYVWRLFRRRDSLVNSPVSTQREIVFNTYSNSLLSTASEEVAKIHERKQELISSQSLKAIKLSDVLPTTLSSSENFVLSIDVEGMEIDVLKTISWESQRPRVILAESWEKPWRSDSKITRYLRANEYSLEAYTGLTAVYVCEAFIKSRSTIKTDIIRNIEESRDG